MAGQRSLHMHRRHMAAQEILHTFEKCDVDDVDVFKAKVLNAGPDALHELIIDALHHVATHIEDLKHKSGGKKPLKLIAYEHDFLKTIAALSPSFKNSLKQAGLLEAETKQILSDQAKLKALEEFLLEVLQAENLKTLHRDLENALHDYVVEENSAAKEQALKLRNKMGLHDQTAETELKDLMTSAIRNKLSNAMFDKVKLIGHLLSSYFYNIYKAPLKNRLYPNATYDHHGVPYDQEAWIQRNNAIYGSPLVPGVAAPVNNAPTANKPGGPGN